MFTRHTKYKKLHRNIFSILLTIIMCLTSINLQPLTVHAIGGENGNLETIKGSVSSYPFGFSDKRQGYRFYVCQNTGSTPTVVSKVVDFVYTTPNVADEHWYTNPRWSPLSTDGSNYECKPISELKNNYCAGSTSPYDITSPEMYPVHIVTQELVGAKFQHFFLGKEGQGGGVFSDGGSFGGSGATTSTKPSTSNKTGSLSNTSQSNEDTSEPVISNTIDGVDDFYTSGKYTNSEIDAFRRNMDMGSMSLNAFASVNKAEEFINDSRQSNFERIVSDNPNCINALKSNYNVAYIASTETLHWSDDLAKLNATGIVFNRAKEYGFDYKTSKAIAYLICNNAYSAILIGKSISIDNLLETSIPLSNITNDNIKTLQSLEEAGVNIDKLSNYLDIQIPLADEIIESDTYVPAVKFISWEQSPFNVKGFTQDLSGNGSVSLYDALKYQDENGNFLYGLVVEPIFIAGMYSGSKTYEPWYTLVSYYNAVQYYVEVLNNTRGSGCHYGYLTLHGKNCMTVSKEVNDYGTGSFKIKAATDGSRMTLDKILGLMNDGYGYGMHFYYGGDLQPSSSETSTFDEVQSVPAKSEDCTSKPDESAYGSKSKTAVIIKCYETEKADGTIQNDGYFIRENVPHQITVESEESIGYYLSEWETSSESSIPYGLTEQHSGNTNYSYEQLTRCSNSLQSGSSTATIKLSDIEKILYVKLVKSETAPVQSNRLDGDFVLTESTIAKAVNTYNFTNIPIKLKFTLPDLSLSCGGHTHDHEKNGFNDSNNNGLQDANESSTYNQETHHHGNEKLSHSEYQIAVKNDNESSNESKNIIVQSNIDKFSSYIKINSLSRASINLQNDRETENYVYNFSIYRHLNGEENLSLCQYNQNQSSSYDNVNISEANKNIIKTLGYSEKTTKSIKNRAEKDYVQLVTLKFVYDMPNSPVTNITNKYDDIHCSYGSFTGESRNGEIVVTSEPVVNSNIAVQVYSGSQSETPHTFVWQETIGKNSEHYLPIRDGANSKTVENMTVGRQVQNSQSIKFNPFIRMQYTTVEELKQGKIVYHPVNVLSEYERTYSLPTDYAELSWNREKDNPNLKVLSNQWAVDEALTNGSKSWAKPNTVLKGGSSFMLSIPYDSLQKLQLRTTQFIVPESNTFISNAESYTVSNAVQAHNDYVQSCIDTFENLNIVQRVSRKIETEIEDMVEARPVTRGSDISFLKNGSSTTSPDSKYYFNVDESNGLNASASESDLDVKTGNTNTTYYKIWTDISGNVLLAKSNNLDSLQKELQGKVILTKNQDINNLIDSEARDLNNRTFVIEKLLNSVERNSGNDHTAYWATNDGKWYNESAQVFVMVQNTTIELGFRDCDRISVIDPKLIPFLSSKSQQGKEAFSSIFTCNDYSEKWGATEKGKIGEFKGKSIYMEDMNKLFVSKVIQIPNMTVQGSR